MAEQINFYDEAALLQRLSVGLKKRTQEVIFLLGAPLSAPVAGQSLGVPDAEGMIRLILDEFSDEPEERSALQRELARSGVRRYQEAFSFLQGRRGQQTANEVVLKAVLAARKTGAASLPLNRSDQAALEAACRTLEFDIDGWDLNCGTESIGRLLAEYPGTFGKTLLTTNFDPLFEVAIQKAGGQYYRTVLHSDGNLGQTEAMGCHVIHLHGYWYGADTLHTARQLGQARPHLKDSLRQLLRNKLVVVCAYGGWDDVFTEALMDVVRDTTAYPEIIWTFHPTKPTIDERLAKQLEPGLDRGRVILYSGVECNRLFPKLRDRWLSLEPVLQPSENLPSNRIYIPTALSEELQNRPDRQAVIEGDDEDRPPLIEICVGRDEELSSLRASQSRVIFLTGIGGQGKSTVAAKYFADRQQDNTFSFFAWRDCKEESERFENQLSEVIEKLSNGAISGRDLANQSAASIVEILFTLIRDFRVLFVFDNIDHYVDLEAAKMTGAVNLFIEELLRSPLVHSQALFTCRPEVVYSNHSALSIHLEGINFDAALKLFSQRGASATAAEIREAYDLTQGHAFWLDLLAIQVGKQHLSVKLPALVAQIAGSAGGLADKTLTSIWATLRDREQIVLRAMAETVKPVTEGELGDYLSGEVNYSKVVRSLKNLRTLNLVVVKKRPQAPDVLELHPLVRQFIRHNFAHQDRISFINRIIRVYQRFIGTHRSELQYRPSIGVLQNWTQSAELDITAGKYQDAFLTLSEVCSAFRGSAYPREFTRTVRALLDAVDWVSEHTKFKQFDRVFTEYIHLMCDLGEHSEVDSVLEKYEMTVQTKDARYINYCDMRCYAKWVRGDFTTAVKWGEIGHRLKTSSGVDTGYDVSHNLALAERDVGRPEKALATFLAGKTLSQVTNPKEVDEKRGGHYYGNIGRCLHLMGQIDSALVCYQKSALLLERSTKEHVVNQGFIRAWIAELLVARQQIKLAYVFFRAAYIKWQQTAPPRAAQMNAMAAQFASRARGAAGMDDDAVESIVIDWILGQEVDSRIEDLNVEEGEVRHGAGTT